MKREYDFKKGERGKFYRRDLQLDLPVYLESDVRDYLAKRAQQKGVELNQMVNELLRRDIEIIEGAG